MRQIFFDRTGKVLVEDVPPPTLGPGQIEVRLIRSVISPGTETMGYDRGGTMAEFARNPSLATKVLEKARVVGVKRTIEVVRDCVNARIPKGYSGCGIVSALGEGVTKFRVGHRVACAGAPHAEVVVLPEMMATQVPDAVSDDQAAFTTLACIPLHGIRLTKLSLGCTAAVVGLGVIGLMAVALLRAAGIRVIAIDLLEKRLEKAKELGADVSLKASVGLTRKILSLTDGLGVDAALICAGSKSSEPINQAMQYCRDRARVVSVGSVGMNLDRRVMFSKELEVLVSRSYGPGRYDVLYEQKGNDYPIGYVPWTEERNAKAVLALLASEKIDFRPLVSTHYNLDEADDAYEYAAGGEDAFGVLLRYQKDAEVKRTIHLSATSKKEGLAVAIFGLGTFARNNIMPNVRASKGVQPYAVVTGSGQSAMAAAKKYGFRLASTDYREVLMDENLDVVIISTRHHLHFPMALAALEAGKAVHVEKPMTLTLAEALRLREMVYKTRGLLTVGFNRRHAPDTKYVRNLLANRHGPLQVYYRVSASKLPRNHWLYDALEGGGRLVGEVCHFVDLCNFLANGAPERVCCADGVGAHILAGDVITVLLLYPDGSQATILYSAVSSPTLAKEHIEIHWDDKTVFINDFAGYLYQDAQSRKEKTHGQDKGFSGHFCNFFAAAMKGEQLLTDVEDGVNVARVIDECRKQVANQ